MSKELHVQATLMNIFPEVKLCTRLYDYLTCKAQENTFNFP